MIEYHAANRARLNVTTLQPVTDAHPGTNLDKAASIPHPHSFSPTPEKRLVKSLALKASPTTYSFTVSSGFKDVTLLKTTGSSFENFHKCPLTTLKPAADRLLCTSVECLYVYPTITVSANQLKSTAPYDAIYNGIKQLTLDVFANHDSPSVQNTLYRMAQTALSRYHQVIEISYTLPNIHYILYDLARFGIEENGKYKNAGIYYPLADPSGLIKATVKRNASKL